VRYQVTNVGFQPRNLLDEVAHFWLSGGLSLVAIVILVIQFGLHRHRIPRQLVKILEMGDELRESIENVSDEDRLNAAHARFREWVYDLYSVLYYRRPQFAALFVRKILGKRTRKQVLASWEHTPGYMRTTVILLTPTSERPSRCLLGS